MCCRIIAKVFLMSKSPDINYRKEKAFILYKLSLISYILSLFIRIIIRNSIIYYIEVSDYFISRKWLNKIRRQDAVWIKEEYVEYSQFNKGNLYADRFSVIISDKVRNNGMLSIIDGFLSEDSRFKKKMDIVWKSNICKSIEPFAFQYAAAEYLANKYHYNKITIISFNSMVLMLKDYFRDDIRVIVWPFLEFMGKFLEAIRRRKLTSYLSMLLINKKKPAVQKNNTPLDIEKFQVAYFPHVGIFYWNLFTKDHFYSKDSKSPFYPSNILHIELDKSRRGEYLDSCDYYSKNKIPFIELPDIMSGNREIIRECLDVFKRNKTRFLNDLWRFGIDFSVMAFFTLWKISRFRAAVSRFKSLKIALAGYDVLFPVELSAALSLCGVYVCASQERFIEAFFPSTYLCMDYYFVSGTIVAERALKKSYIEHVIPVGLVRVDKLFEYEQKKIPDEKYDVIKKNKKLILVLDFIMPENDIENIRRFAGTVSQAQKFYNDIINLAVEFPSLYFVVKGKHTDSYGTDYLKNIVERINQIGNIEIEMDLNVYNPYYLSEKADLTIIAIHTSLGDELLAAGREVIFYEISDVHETIFDYDCLPIMVKDYEGLREQVQRILNGEYLSQDVIDILKRDFYNNCFHGNVRSTIRTFLEQLIGERCEQGTA